MKTIGALLIIAGFTFACGRMYYRFVTATEYSNRAGSYWSLADRASTLAQKSEYIDKYVNAVESMELSGLNSALFFVRPSTSFDENFKAVRSLQSRLMENSGMDEQSFAYQTAIQQITAQEQGEGDDVFDNIYECWQRKYHYTYWNPLIITGFLILQVLMIIAGVALLMMEE